MGMEENFDNLLIQLPVTEHFMWMICNLIFLAQMTQANIQVINRYACFQNPTEIYNTSCQNMTSIEKT